MVKRVVGGLEVEGWEKVRSGKDMSSMEGDSLPGEKAKRASGAEGWAKGTSQASTHHCTASEKLAFHIHGPSNPPRAASSLARPSSHPASSAAVAHHLHRHPSSPASRTMLPPAAGVSRGGTSWSPGSSRGAGSSGGKTARLFRMRRVLAKSGGSGCRVLTEGGLWGRAAAGD